MAPPNSVVTLNEIAGFMTVDSDFWVASRFQRLHLINLLSAQQRLSAIEQDIDDHVRYENCLTDGLPCPTPTKPSVQLFEELRDCINAYSTTSSTSLSQITNDIYRRGDIIISEDQGVREPRTARGETITRSYSKLFYFP